MLNNKLKEMNTKNNKQHTEQKYQEQPTVISQQCYHNKGKS